MPTENEKKYVLSPSFNAESLVGWSIEHIEQGYLENGVRIRRSNDDYFYTYKRWVESAQRLIEIDPAIDARDYNDLKTECHTLLLKTRYKKEVGQEEWVVDFLRNKNGKNYFVMAEVEMPEGVDDPQQILPEIAESVVWTVEKNDARFTNRKLVKESHAIQMYKMMGVGI